MYRSLDSFPLASPTSIYICTILFSLNFVCLRPCVWWCSAPQHIGLIVSSQMEPTVTGYAWMDQPSARWVTDATDPLWMRQSTHFSSESLKFLFIPNASHTTHPYPVYSTEHTNLFLYSAYYVSHIIRIIDEKLNKSCELARAQITTQKYKLCSISTATNLSLKSVETNTGRIPIRD